VLDDMFGRNTSTLNFYGVQIGERELQRLQYLGGGAEIDSLARPSFADMSVGSYGSVTYGKTATMLVSLETIVGEQALRTALHNYFMKYRFRHPTQEEFLQSVNESVGQDLGWYWNQAVYGTQILDYEVLRANSTPVNWYDKDPDDNKDTVYETQVILHRRGDFIFPVQAEVKFENGDVEHVRWDGKDRWARFVYHKKSKVVSAQIDPQYDVTLDRNYLNNSRTVDTQHQGIDKIVIYWTFVTQFLGQMMAWLT
jgi:hypothetical protein